MGNVTGEKLDLSPSKDVYRAVKSDVTPVSAIKELVDNALDNWERLSDKTDPLHIQIEYHSSTEELVIRDDSGGVERENIAILFALGESKKGAITGAIGAYGIGAKKAIVNLGNEALIKSRYLEADNAVGFRVDEEWLSSEGIWEVDLETFDDLDPGFTEIRIGDLNIESWTDIREQVRSELRYTYQKFLGSDRETDTAELTILVDDEVIEPPEPINWSFTPFDGLYPRRYENILLTENLSEDNYPSPVYLTLTVGLLQTSSERESGTDIFCQKRQVLRSAEDERAGYDKLGGQPTGQHKRLRVILEFETDGDAERLPWDTQKNDINPYDPLAQEAYDWVRRAVQPYFDADYEDVPQTFLRPYDAEQQFAANGGEIESYDYHDRARVTDKADGKFPQVSALKAVAETHAFLRIYCKEHLKRWEVPAYELELQRVFQKKYPADSARDIDLVDQSDRPMSAFRNAEGEININEAIDEHVVSDAIGVIDEPDPGLAEYVVDEEQIVENIRYHVTQRVVHSELKNWQLPCYLFHYSQFLSDDVTFVELSERVSNPFDPEDAEVVAEPPSGESQQRLGQRTTQPTPDTKNTTTDEGSPSQTGSAERRSSGAVTGSGPQSSSPEAETDSPPRLQQTRARRLTLTDDQWQQLCEKFGLTTDVSEEQLIQAILDAEID